MALIKCPECGKEISSLAVACPNCGAPIQSASASPPASSSAPIPTPVSASGSQSFVDKNLLPGEAVVYRTKLHWSNFVKLGLSTLILLAAAVFFLYLKSQGWQFWLYCSLASLLGAILTALAIVITYVTSEFAVTNKRVLIKVGFIQRTSFELLLKQVESILVEQGIVGRMLGFGTIIVIGTGGSKEEFDYISDPLEFRKQVQSQIASH